jgi:hypothetical protein
VTDELEYLQGFRQVTSEPTAGLQERLEERLWQQVIEDEARQAQRREARRARFWPTIMRQGAVAGVAATFVVVLAFTKGSPGGDPGLADTGTAGLSAAGLVSGIPAIGAARSARNALSADPQSQSSLVSPPAELNSYPVVPGYAGEPSLLNQGPAAMDEDQLDDIPTDAAGLHAALHNASAGQYPGHDDDFGVFRLAADFLADPDISTDLRSGLLDMLGRLDNIQVGGAAQDILGRPGEIVARADHASGVRQVQMLDTDTAQVLEELEFTTRLDQASGCVPGLATSLKLYDDSGAQIDADAAPYAQWPTLVAQCG